MLSRSLPRSVNRLAMANLTRANVRGFKHVKNLWEENSRAINQDIQDNNRQIQVTDKVYTPLETLEFNRTGELLLFSCDPIKHTTVYLKYPYIFYESLIPASLWMFYVNPFDYTWQVSYLFLVSAGTLWWPRVQYFAEFKNKIRRMYLMRGGKGIKVELGTLALDRQTCWAEIHLIKPLTADKMHFAEDEDAQFLTEEGQLQHELSVQIENFTERGVTSQDRVLTMMKEGIVHHPEIFEAVCKGFRVDTSNYSINTAHNVRVHEGHYNI